ncbi:hypothetical protein [Aminobacter sp. LjRoot7]|uniref:hypothetical protein n=1 Tax=Aminobacter sp. LjRoot7 TaxID=3342335 RepID=UPI003ECF2E12
MTITRKDVVSVLGRVDDAMIAELILTEASLAELKEAWAWVFGDDALMGEGRPLPGSRVAALIDLIAPDEDDDGDGPAQGRS